MAADDLDGTADDSRPLRGRLVITTRDAPGELEQRLIELGARVHHLPLIRISDIDDAVDGPWADRLARALDALPDDGWVMVTSRHGAVRVGPAVADRPLGLRLAAVGAATAEVLSELAGRAVDLVPGTQTAAALVDAVAAAVDGPRHIVVAQAEQAAPTLVEGLRALGHRVEVVTLYRTELLTPDPQQWAAVRAADAVTLLSGTAARAWAAAVAAAGEEVPAPPAGPVLCAIGPATAATARDLGLPGVHEARRQSVDGVVEAVVRAIVPAPD